MLAEMTDAEWQIVAEACRAARSRRGGRGRETRKFLEALYYFTVHNITWRALPREFGKWNSIWKRFWRFSQRGVFGDKDDTAQRKSRPAAAAVRVRRFRSAGR